MLEWHRCAKCGALQSEYMMVLCDGEWVCKHEIGCDGRRKERERSESPPANSQGAGE